MTKATDTPDALEPHLIAFARGEAEAARALIAALAPRLLAFATRMLGDAVEAEDVVQETFLRLWKIAPEWRRGEAKVSTWAFRVASNLATDRLRRRGRLHDLDDAGDPASDAPPAIDGIARSEQAAALDAALARLPARQREAVVLRHMEALPNPEVARIMGISVEAVESLTARGRRELKAMLMPKKEGLLP